MARRRTVALAAPGECMQRSRSRRSSLSRAGAVVVVGLAAIGGLAAFLGLLLATNRISLRRFSAVRLGPLHELVDELRGGMSTDAAHALEGGFAVAGLAALALCCLALIVTAARFKGLSRPVRAGLLALTVLSALLAIGLLEMALHYSGVWPDPPGRDLAERALLATVNGLRIILGRDG
jgi:hypothetical protein